MNRSSMRRGNRARLAGVALVAALLAAAPLAQTRADATACRGSASGPSWQALSPTQRSALAPLKNDWAGIDAARKQKWLEIAARFAAMPPDERARVQARMEQWVRLSPAERNQARLQYQQARQLPAQDRSAAWDAYLALPADEQRALAERARTAARASTATATRPGAKAPAAAGAAQPVATQAGAHMVIQVKPGATTTLITQTRASSLQQPALEQRPKLPRNRVDRKTLLPPATAQQTPRPAAVERAAPPPADADRPAAPAVEGSDDDASPSDS